MIGVEDFISAARGWLGVPFVHQGRSRFGVDCVGLVMCVRHEIAPWPDVMAEPRAYRRRVVGAALADKMAFYGEEVDTPAAGVVALIGWPGETHASHVGILTGKTIIHAYERVHKVVEVGYQDPWVRWTRALYRVPGVSYV